MINKRIWNIFLNEEKRKRAILNQTKKEKNIIYGAQSIKKQVGIFSRGTQDYDIFSKKPKQSANTTDKNLDKIYGWNYHYVKPALHPGTWKVMARGTDMKKGTKDDVGIVDYSKIPIPTPRYRRIDGVRYRRLSQEKKAKYRALRDSTQKFRHQKDKEDLERIKIATGKRR